MAATRRNGRSRWVAALALVAGLAFAVAAAVRPAPLTLVAGAGEAVALADAILLLPDPDAALDAAAARAAFAAGRFAPLPAGRTELGYRRGAVWFHVRIEHRDHPARDWLLLLDDVRPDVVEFWFGDGPIVERGGERAAPDARVMPNRARVALTLQPGEALDLLGRVRSTGSLALPLRLLTPAALDRALARERFALGLLLGFIAALALAAALLALLLSDAAAAWFAAAALATVPALLAAQGWGAALLWPALPGLDATLHPLATLLATALLLETGQRAFGEASALPRRVPTAVQLALALIAALALTPWRPVALAATPWAALFALAVLIRITYGAARRGARTAWPLAAAAAMLTLLALALGLSDLGVLARALPGDAVRAVLALALALGFAALLLRQRARTAVELGAAATARVALERRVAARTQQLERAAAQLKELNHLLRDMSLRDALTGLYNRRCIDQVLVEAWDTSAAQRQELSLLMIDIDHFKSINDRFGHAVGDDTLREVASRIARQATTLGAIAGRYGGEEFIVVLPGAGTEIATGLAEAVRSAVGAAPVKTQSLPLAVSVSIGVASAWAGADATLDALVRRADHALYEAKRTGRNRVVLR